MSDSYTLTIKCLYIWTTKSKKNKIFKCIIYNSKGKLKEYEINNNNYNSINMLADKICDDFKDNENLSFLVNVRNFGDELYNALLNKPCNVLRICPTI